MMKLGYQRCEYDCCAYHKKLHGDTRIYLVLYVDDILIATQNMEDIEELKRSLSAEFEMKDLGAARKILGVEIYRDRTKKKLFFSQAGIHQEDI